MMNNYAEALDFISGKIRLVYEQVMAADQLEIYDKSAYDEVTSVDLQIERKLIEEIMRFDPQAHILSEEYNSTTQRAGRTWIIDPIDGTCNFSHGLPAYGVQCALYAEGEVQLSVIFFPFSNELFTALRGEGVWLNGKRVHAKARPVNRSIISFGDFVHADPARMELEHKLMKHVSGRVERIRMYGAASLDFAYAACGRIDGNFTFVQNPWDIMPGLLMCKEAGMVITDAYGNPYTDESGTVAVFSGEELKNACIPTVGECG